MGRKRDETWCPVIREAVAKAAPATAAAGATAADLTGLLPFDAGLAVLALAGIIIGAMIRVARMVKTEAAWREIRRDVIVSALVALGNMILVLVLHSEFGLDPLQMLGVAVLVGFLGLEAIRMASGFAVKLWNSAIDRLLEERAKARAEFHEELADREGQLRNEIQAQISEIRVAEKIKEGSAPPPPEGGIAP